MPRHSTNTCFLVHSQEKILLSLTLVRIGEMIQEMPFRMCFPHVLMAGRPQQILHGGTLKYLFGYIKIRIFYCNNRSIVFLFQERRDWVPSRGVWSPHWEALRQRPFALSPVSAQ